MTQPIFPLFEKWNNYMEGFSSPQNFIDWGYHSLISAALQRRVWAGPNHSPLYSNTYTILVADPGIGKGLVIKEIAKALKFHKLDPARLAKQFSLNTATNDERIAMEYLAEEDYKMAHAEQNKMSQAMVNGQVEKPLLLPVAADATTYEALIRTLSNSVRRINYRDNGKMGIYMHSSLSFCLEELSSLLRKRTEDVVNCLIKCYDAEDYTYDTKTQGKDRVRKCCLNLVAGTTPAFLQSSFDDFLLTEGFSSRTFFIYAARNRKSSLWIPELNETQKQDYKDILEHLYKLAHLYGHVEIDKETELWLEDWWKDFDGHPEKRANKSTKLLPYYSRKNIHVVKLAMAIHFGESLELKIPRYCFERAIEFLAKEELTMSYALAIEKQNPLSSASNKILRHLQINGKQTRKSLISEFWGCMNNPNEDIDNILEHLLTEDRIEKLDEEHAIMKKIITYYSYRNRIDNTI